MEKEVLEYRSHPADGTELSSVYSDLIQSLYMANTRIRIILDKRDLGIPLTPQDHTIHNQENRCKGKIVAQTVRLIHDFGNMFGLSVSLFVGQNERFHRLSSNTVEVHNLPVPDRPGQTFYSGVRLNRIHSSSSGVETCIVALQLMDKSPDLEVTYLTEPERDFNGRTIQEIFDLEKAAKNDWIDPVYKDYVTRKLLSDRLIRNHAAANLPRGYTFEVVANGACPGVTISKNFGRDTRDILYITL